MGFIINHASSLLEAITLVHAAALIIVNITPTPKDNEFLEGASNRVNGFYRVIEMLAGIFNSNRVKD